MASAEPTTLPAPVIDPATPPLGKWAQEHRAFRRLLLGLIRTHRGLYVAIHDGQVIASGRDKLTVALEAFRQVGNVSIHVGLADEEAEPVFRSGVRRVLPPQGGIRYAYVPQLQPPAPFVYLRALNPITGAELRDVPAQLDTAADRTLIPEALAQALNLPQLGALLIGGVGGVQQSMPTHPLTLTIHDLPSLTIEAVASPGESWILLGRDVLNAFRILLDGPQLALELS